jgi:LacI family transcriptional regulator
MSIRLKDIAEDLGLSVVTVSKVLRNHPDIGAATRERVLQRMKELNYQPNLTARSLVAGQTWTLGLVVPDLLHPFFAVIAKAISAHTAQHGYSLLIASSDEDPELETHELQQLLARRVDVILVASSQRSLDSFRLMEQQNTPYILIDRRLEGLDAPFIGTDDEQVGALATTHLLERGCRRIAHIRGPEVSTATGRLAGYRQALASWKLEPLPGHIVSLGPSGDHRGTEAGYEAAKTLLASTPRPDGIFCYNDPSAMGAMRAILEAGWRIPEDVAVIGCGNISYSDFLRVPLSSIDQSGEEIGQRAATLALKLARNKQTRIKPRAELMTPRLVARASTERPVRSGRKLSRAR